jgi:hypothetical protein
VHRLRGYLTSIALTPLGIVVLTLLVVASALFALGPSEVQAPAMVVGVILLIGVVGGVPFGAWGAGGWRGANLDERRASFHATQPQEILATQADRQAEEELWRKERERYAQDKRSG